MHEPSSATIQIAQAMQDEELTAICLKIRTGAMPTEMEQAALNEMALRDARHE